MEQEQKQSLVEEVELPEYLKHIFYVIFFALVGFVFVCLYLGDEIRKAHTHTDKWTIISGIASVIAILFVIVIYVLDNLEKESDRKKAMEKEHKDRQEAMRLQENERTLNKNFVILVNFMLHYLSIESSLFHGILNIKEKLYTTPNYLAAKFEYVQISRDNIFAFLNILYSIDYCVTMCVEMIDANKMLFPLVDQISCIRTLSNSFETIQYAANQSGLDYVYYYNNKFYYIDKKQNGENLEIDFPLYLDIKDVDKALRESQKKHFLVAYDNDLPIYAVAFNYKEQIRERLGFTIDRIKEIDKSCRDAVGYSQWEPQEFIYTVLR